MSTLAPFWLQDFPFGHGDFPSRLCNPFWQDGIRNFLASCFAAFASVLGGRLSLSYLSWLFSVLAQPSLSCGSGAFHLCPSFALLVVLRRRSFSLCLLLPRRLSACKAVCRSVCYCFSHFELPDSASGCFSCDKTFLLHGKDVDTSGASGKDRCPLRSSACSMSSTCLCVLQLFCARLSVFFPLCAFRFLRVSFFVSVCLSALRCLWFRFVSSCWAALGCCFVFGCLHFASLLSVVASTLRLLFAVGGSILGCGMLVQSLSLAAFSLSTAIVGHLVSFECCSLGACFRCLVNSVAWLVRSCPFCSSARPFIARSPTLSFLLRLVLDSESCWKLSLHAIVCLSF
jgi:hypothetical protein